MNYASTALASGTAVSMTLNIAKFAGGMTGGFAFPWSKIGSLGKHKIEKKIAILFQNKCLKLW